MDEGRFDQPVRVFVEKRGNIADTVTTTVQAADILLHRWPGDPGARRHLAARKACIAVLEGIKDARAARLAFEAAAKEADILAPAIRPIPASDSPQLWRSGRRHKLKRDQ
ncbi:MAG: DUF982 domain-containing protein [Rhizobiaceae bacterium]|nr:DUF982 domain-containing protein [Rhizobiaceae bacterium]